MPISKAFGMEELLMKYSVDLAVWAHEHEYERTWPLYDYRNAITDYRIVGGTCVLIA